MLRRSFACATGLLALSLALHGCSSGGGSNNSALAPSGTTTVVLDSTQGTPQGTFGFTITDLTIARTGAPAVTLEPYASNVVGIEYQFDGTGNDGQLVGQTVLPAGHYTSVTVFYENARVILPSGDFFATPSQGSITVPLRGPLNLTQGGSEVVNLTVDVAATVLDALTVGGTFQPSIFGRCLCDVEAVPLTEFDGNVVGVNPADGSLTVSALATQSNGQSFALGQIPVHVTSDTVAIPGDDLPRTVNNGLNALAGIVGESVEIEAVVTGTGTISASAIESDNVGFQGRNEVQIEGVVVQIGQNSGAPEFGVFVTRVEDDDLGQLTGNVGTIPLRFTSPVPRVYFEADRMMVGADRIQVGMLIEAEGFIQTGNTVNTADTSGDAHNPGPGNNPLPGPVREVPEPDFPTGNNRTFIASAVEVRNQFLTGTVTESMGGALFEASVDTVETVPGSFDLDLLIDGSNVTPLVNGILPVDPEEVLHAGTEVIVYGSYAADPEGRPHPTAMSAPPLPLPAPEKNVFRDFNAKILFIRGQEFEGEELFFIDPNTGQFVIMGDGRSLGLNNPSSITVFVIKEARTVVKGTNGIALGLSRKRALELMIDASSVSLKGYLSSHPETRGVEGPLFIATNIEIELGRIDQPR